MSRVSVGCGVWSDFCCVLGKLCISSDVAIFPVFFTVFWRVFLRIFLRFFTIYYAKCLCYVGVLCEDAVCCYGDDAF